MSWFQSFIGFLADGLSKFMDAFVSVSSAVTSFAITPIFTLLISLFTSLTSALCELMELLGTSIPSMFLLDIGTGQSFFEIVVGGLGLWMDITRVMGFCLLVFFAFSAILRCMATMDSQGVDSPVRIVVMSVICSVLIYRGPSIIVFVETKLCAPIYNFLITWGQVDIDFSTLHLSQTLSNFMKQDASFLEPTQGKTLLASAILFFIFMMITTRFIGYVFEIGQRYVILGILIIMSPMSFTFLISKSTSTTFSKWMKMVASQLFLMMTNIIFVAVFFRGLLSFEALTDYCSSVEGDMAVGKTAVVVMWGILLYSILYIGGKIDSYLQTLGISTAESGSDMMTAFVADVLDTGVIEGFIRGESPRHPGSVFSMAVRRTGEALRMGREISRSDRTVASSMIQFRKMADGRTVPTVSSINETVKNMSANDSTLARRTSALTVEQKREVGKSVLASARGIPQTYKNYMNPETCSIENNSITMESHRDKDGAFFGVTMVPKMFFEGRAMPAGRDVTIGDTTYRAIAFGPKARDFNTYNPIARRELSEQYPEGMVTPITNQPEFGQKQGTPTGMYQTIIKSDDGKSVTIHQWAPTTQYHVPVTVPSTTEHIGNMDYYHSQLHVPLDGNGNMVVTCGYGQQIPGSGPYSAADKVDWTKRNFPTALSQGYIISGPSAGDTLTFDNNGDRYVFFPAARYAVSYGLDGEPSIQNIQTIIAENGAPYFFCREASITPGSILEKEHMGEDSMGDTSTVFVERNIAAAQQFWTQSIPDIVKRAREIRISKNKDQQGEE